MIDHVYQNVTMQLGPGGHIWYLSVFPFRKLVKTDFLHSKPFQSSQSPFPPFQALPVGPKFTSSFPSRSSRAKTDFFYSKPFQSGQNRPSPFQVIPVGPKPTSSIPRYSSRAKTDFPLFQDIPVGPKPTTSISSLFLTHLFFGITKP
jgi:hypothetical protein